MNERLLTDPAAGARTEPGDSRRQIEEILFRALARDPRHRYSTAAEMAWELEHQELVGVETGEQSANSDWGGSRSTARKMALYAGAGPGSVGVVRRDVAVGEALV